MQGRKPPLSFQGRTAATEIEAVSKAAWVDVATMLAFIIHDGEPGIDLRDPVQLAGLLLAYARPILKARGDRDPFPPAMFVAVGPNFANKKLNESIAIAEIANSYDAPAWDENGGRG